MKIKTLKFSLFLLVVLSLIVSCKDDDDINTIPFVLADRTEQQAKDNDSIVEYLNTHYYNSSFFESGTNHKYTDIIIEKLEEGEVDAPSGHTLLMGAVETHTTEYLETEYKYYILKLNQGEGEAPTFTDMVRVRYEGANVESEEVFDYNISPDDFALQADGTNQSVIKAWQLVMPMFNSSDDFSINNGIVEFNNFGLGVMFVPSGLAYFAGTTSIAAYSNLIFKFELLQYEVEDHDNDGIPSYIEDLDADLDVTNDDTDEDLFPNFVDRDDDNDEVLTIDELISEEYVVDTNLGETEPVLAANEFERSRTTVNGIITIKTVIIADANSDGTPDYLDENISTNYNEESN